MLAALDGAGLHPDSGGRRTFGGTGKLLYRALGMLRNAIADLGTLGITPVFRGVLWHQGERDAQAIDRNALDPEDFKSGFPGLIDRYRSELGDERAPFFVFQIGRPRDDDTRGFRQVRRIQREVANADPHTTIVFDDCVDFPEEGKMADALHYGQGGLNEMGRAGAAAVAQRLV